MEFSQIRKKLDKIDEELLKIIVKRMSLIPEVAKYKAANKLKRYQPKREKEIIAKKRALAKKLKVNPDLIEDIIKRIIKESHRIEKKIIGK